MPVYRIEVRAIHSSDDPSGAGVLSEIRQLGLIPPPEVVDVRSTRIFLLQGPQSVLTPENLERIANEVLIDPVTERFSIGESPGTAVPGLDGGMIEVHLKPGVMDPVAASCEAAIKDLLGTEGEGGGVEVRTGRKFVLLGHVNDDQLRLIAKRLLVNESIETGYFEPFTPGEFPVGHPYTFKLTHVPLRELSDEQLLELSRKGHLFLDLREMQAIQHYFRDQNREPTDAELETLAQTWSEHCVHKTLKATVEFVEKPGERSQKPEARSQKTEDVAPVIIDNLVKSTVFKATMDLAKPWALSVFKDNAGVIAFDDETAVCMKVETHNRPSAIEPYGGAATGIGGCIRDVIGTGLGARPFANTDVFCFANPQTPAETLPAGVIHPRRSAQRVVAGVRDYGNRMGIPTVNGAVFFDDRYVGNPLVFCGTVGVMPRKFAEKGKAKPGDHIVVIGGRTGRDGIHGATFSSDVVTTSHADEFSHAVQIGNAITEKKMLDVILQARDLPEGPLYHAITDCGAGGLSSAVGEMGEKTGATVELERVPLKYQGLSYAEIWISEAQERMVLAVPEENVQRLLDLCDAENVEATDIGLFDGTGKLTLHYQNTLVGQMDMAFVHDGIPKPTRQAVYTPPSRIEPHIPAPKDYAATLHALLKMPTIASKHWIIRQYDHEVQGGTVIKPLVGPNHDGPGDASVVRPLWGGGQRAVVLANGCQPRFGDIDPYQMALSAIDEAVRNIVCVGGDPEKTAILDNFCWPKCTDPQNLGALVKACQACYDGAIAYGTPFVSGKDSLSNEFITDKGQRIQIPYTLLISAMSVIDNAANCITMDAKQPGNHLLLVGLTRRELGGSHYFALHHHIGSSVPVVDLKTGPATAKTVAKLLANRLITSAHDLSEGGLAVALAEMLFAGNLGATIDLAGIPATPDASDDATLLFSESASRYLLEIRSEHFDAVARVLKQAGIPFGVIGTVTDSASLKIRSLAGTPLMDEPVVEFKKSWLMPLDW
ncbi:MAG: phosphoribosylformylglycinamidine synthase subunit PurL [Phycisphaerales bacterium]|nr:phosphoribosylformylglycinamidine synthase subunit PurL [Phycisphaerales bacterium]